MRRLTNLAMAACAVLFCFSSFGPAAAQMGGGQKASIEYRVPEGLQYSFQQVYVLDSTLNLSGGGQSMTAQQQVRTQLDGRATVLRVQNGKPAQLRVRFGPSSGTQITLNGAVTPQPFPLAGQDVVITVQNERVVSIAPAGGGPGVADPALADLISPVVVFEDSLRPGRPVGVGEQWPAQIVESGGTGQTNMTLQVAGFEQRGNRPAARLQAQGVTWSNANGFSMNGPVSAAILVDVATGLPLETNGMATVQMSGATVQNGQPVQITGTGRINTQVRLALGNDTLPALPPVAGPQGQLPQAQAPASQRRPQTRPQARPDLDPRVVGVFQGEAMAGSVDIEIIVNTQLWWVFRDDGIVYYGAKTYFSASRRDYDQELEWTAHGNTAGNVAKGRWRTDGRILSIQWDDGRSMRVAYGIEPDGTLVFRNANTGKLINYFPRVH